MIKEKNYDFRARHWQVHQSDRRDAERMLLPCEVLLDVFWRIMRRFLPSKHICSSMIPSCPLLVFPMLLCLLSSGCITEATKGIAYRCRNVIPIVERYGEVSNAKDSVSFSLKELKVYHYEPFWDSSFTLQKPKQTFTYSLTTPPSGAELSKWVIVPDEKANRFMERRFDILDEDGRFFKSGEWRGRSSNPPVPRHKNPLILPVGSFLLKKPMTELAANMNVANEEHAAPAHNKCNIACVHVHAEDIHYLSRPFLCEDDKNHFKLQIPYRIENDVVYLYSPKESEKLFRPYDWEETNIARGIWRVIIPPVTIVMDIVLLPFEAVGLLYFIIGMGHL